MQRILILAAIVSCIIAVDCLEADAWPFRRRRRRSNYSATYATPAFGGTDQQRCLQEASLMASRGIRGHVGGLIGAFEGCGWGAQNCATCTPGRGMRLTGDASVYGVGGIWYRVRSWR